MSTYNLFKSNLQGRALIREIAATRKGISAAGADFLKSIDAEFCKILRADDIRARNAANAAKGRYMTAINVVAACYPFQDVAPVVTDTPADKEKGTPRIVSVVSGQLIRKGAKDEKGARNWAAVKLTAAAARGIVRDSLNNFTKTVGAPVVEVHAVGDIVE